MITKIFRDMIKKNEADLILNRFRSGLARLKETQPIKIDFKKSKIIFLTSNHQKTIIKECLEMISNRQADIKLNNRRIALARLIKTQPTKINFNKSKIMFPISNYLEAIIRYS